MKAVLWTTDLMCASQTGVAAARAGVKLATAMSREALLAQVPDKRLALLDLSERGELAQLVGAIRRAAPGIRVVAFGAHVDEAALAAARQAGCDLVLTRGQFHKQAEELLRQTCAAG